MHCMSTIDLMIFMLNYFYGFLWLLEFQELSFKSSEKVMSRALYKIHCYTRLNPGKIELHKWCDATTLTLGYTVFSSRGRRLHR